MHLLVCIWPFLITILVKVHSQQYELPPIISSDDRSVRLNEIQEISEPNIMLNKIYRRQVYKVQPVPNESSNYSMLTDFPPCKQTPPEITFKNIGYYHLEQPSNPYSQTQQMVTNSTEVMKKSTSIIFDYEALKVKTQNIIDMVFFDNQIFTISSTGIINVYRLNSELENGIALMTSVKGIDWENLYQIRMDKWKLAEEEEKHRLELIEEINKKIAQREKRKNQPHLNDSTGANQSLIDNVTLGVEDQPILGEQNPPLLGQQPQTTSNNTNNTNNTNNSKLAANFPLRLLQNIDFNSPSPKVQQNNITVNPKVKNNQSLTSQEGQNITYYTGPPPQKVRQYLQKGYFQLLQDNKLLVFSNNEYLIGIDLVKNQSILFSEQLSFDYLFAQKDIKNATKNGTINSTTGIKTSNQTINKTIATNTTTLDNKTANSTTNTTITNKTIANTTQPINQTLTNATATNTTTNKTTPSLPQEQQIPPFPEPKPPVLRQFDPLNQFQEITKINETHFAIFDKKRGVVIYEILKRRLNTSSQFVNNPESYFIRKAFFLGKEQFGKTYQENQEMNLVDIAFSKNKSLLLVLDYEKGVVAFEKSQPKNTTVNQTVKDQQKLTPSFILSPYTILKKMCTLMQFSQPSHTLFLSCNKIYKVSLATWPKITQKTYPHPLINIRQIFVEQDQDLFILSGYSVFKVMYLERTTNYFQDDMLDKIIFNKDLAITANQNHIIALKYRVDKPGIVCSTSNKSLLGMHSLVLRTTAQCNEGYMRSINYTKPQGENDICVYTVYKNIFIWEQGQVPLKPLAIVMLVFLIFLVVMIIWFVLIKFRMHSAQNRMKYLSEQGRKELVEEEVESNKDARSQKDTTGVQKSSEYIQSQKQDSVFNTQEQEPNKDLYSIE